MPTPTIHRQNLARQIRAGRAMAKLTRVELAKQASLAHSTVKMAEEGDPAVAEDALGKICRAMEALGFEFVDGTLTPSLAFHDQDEEGLAGITADASMPGWVRRIYPRRLDARSLSDDLEACGVQIDNKPLLLDLCATKEGPWLDTFIALVAEGRKLGIRFRWREAHENSDGLRHVAERYEMPLDASSCLLNNILPPGRG